MELEELKDKWKQLDEHVKIQDEKIHKLINLVAENKVKSPLATMKRHCIIAVIFVPLMLPYFFWMYDFVGLECAEWQKILLYVLTWVFIVFTFVREIYFIIDLKRINVGEDTAVEALRRVVQFRKHYHWGVVIDLILGISLYIVMACSFNEALIIPGLIGVLVGGIVGCKIYRYYERIINEMETALHDWIEE